MKSCNDRRMIRGTKGEQVAVDMGSKPGIESGNLRQVGHHVVDPAERMRVAIAVADASVPIVFCNDEVGEVVGKPLAERVIMIFSMEIREVDPGVTRHAGIQVSHEDGGVQGGVTGCEGPSDDVVLGVASGSGINMQGNQVQRDGGELQQDLKSTTCLKSSVKDAAGLMQKLPTDQDSNAAGTRSQAWRTVR
jgi:hypothetical protein